MAKTMTTRLRWPSGAGDLGSFDSRATPGAPGGKKRTQQHLPEQAEQLSRLQDRFYAEAAGGGERSVLLVLQGMDTSGKGGVIRHVVGALNPQGCSIASFKRPTEIELRHHFLWRVRRQMPAAGKIGVFDRSHYEDVLVARVKALAEPAVIDRRYAEIIRFEQRLVENGTTIVKCFLHVSADEQRERLLARLDDPDKHWKYNPGDLAERAMWAEYQAAYALALERCSTDAAPWYVVPSDRKWYRNWAVGQLLVEALSGLDPQYPRGEFDVEAERTAVRAS